MNLHEAWKWDVDGVDLVLGIWMFVIPFILGGGLPRITLIALAALGLIAAADALWALGKPEMRSPEWVMGIVGVAMFVSPWLLEFTAEAAIAWNAWIVGAIFAVDAAFAYLVLVRTASATHQTAH
jgi:hypothetical protein